MIGSGREEVETQNRSWGLTAHRGWARLLLDRWCLVGTSNTPRGYSNRSNYRSDPPLGGGKTQKKKKVSFEVWKLISAVRGSDRG